MPICSGTQRFFLSDRPLLPADCSRESGQPRRPPWLLLCGALLIFAPLLEGGTTHLAVMVIRLAILLLCGLFLMQGIRTGLWALPRFRCGLAVAAYLGLAVLATLRSPYTNQSVQWLIVLGGYAALLVLLVAWLDRWSYVEQLLTVLVGMGVFEAGLALAQRWWFDAARPSGTFFNPNFLAGYLVLAWALVLSRVCYGSAGRLRRSCRRSFGAIVASPQLLASVVGGLVLAWALLRTGSRGGMAAALAATGVVVGLRFGLKGLGGVAVLLVPLLLLSPNPFRERLEAEHVANPVSYARVQMWRSSVREMADAPLGIGLGLYQYGFPKYNFPVEGQITRYGRVAQTAHNEFLQMGVELGVAGLLVFCWGIVLAAKEWTWLLGRRLARRQRAVLVGVGAAIAGTLVHAGVDANLHEPALALALTLCAGVVLSARRMVTSEAEPGFVLPVRVPVAWTVAGILLLGGVAVLVVRMGLAWTAYESGSQALAQRQIERALQRYRTAVALDPGKSLYHSAMGAAYLQAFESGRDPAAAQAAVEELRSAMRLNPLDGRLSGLLGQVYRQLSLPEVLPSSPEEQRALRAQAVAAFERAVELDPFAPMYRLELGRLWLALGDPEQAERWVAGAVEREPNFLPGREWLAKRHLDAGRLDLAERERREILERQQRYAAWVQEPFEKQFLKVDGEALQAVIERKRERS